MESAAYRSIKKVTIKGDWLPARWQSPFERASGHAGIFWILSEDYPKRSISAIKATLGFGRQAVIVEFTRRTDKLCADDNAVWKTTLLQYWTLALAPGFVSSTQEKEHCVSFSKFYFDTELSWWCCRSWNLFWFVQEINWPNAQWLRSKEKGKPKRNEVKEEYTTTRNYNKVLFGAPSNRGVCFSSSSSSWDVRNGSGGSSSLMDPMRRSVTSQVQQPQDDVTGVAAIQLAALLVCFLLRHAGLVQDAALCGRSRS